jgi:hypothetical protein
MKLDLSKTIYKFKQMEYFAGKGNYIKCHIRQSSCDEFRDPPRCQTVIREWYKRQVRLAICSCHRSSQPSLGVKPLQ